MIFAKDESILESEECKVYNRVSTFDKFISVLRRRTLLQIQGDKGNQEQVGLMKS